MRTILLMVAVLAIGGGALWLFVLRGREATPAQVAAMQAAAARRESDGSVAASRPNGEGGGGNVVGSGQNLWLQTLDPKTHRLANEFTAERFDPRRDGPIDVTKPRARFYFPNGRVIILEGESGRVVMSGAGGNDPQAMQTQAPSRGELRGVTIHYVDFIETASDPIFTINVDNIVFDNTTYRIATTDAIVDGRRVPADQIPVTVRGRDYEFDGTGLVAQWNDVANRIEVLEIAHGRRLLIRNPADLMPEDSKSSASLRWISLQESASVGDAIAAALFGQLVSDVPLGGSPVDVSELRQRTSEYLAVFDTSIVVRSGDQEIARGDALRATFEIDPQKPTDADGETAAAPAGARKPKRTPKPSDPPELTQPLEITWSGKLRVVPAATVDRAAPATAPTTAPAEASRYVELIGAPAQVRRQGSLMQAPSIIVEASAGRLQLVATPQHPQITLERPDGSRIVARGLDVDQSRGQAIITGPGTMFSAADAATARESIDIRFGERAIVDFVEIDQQPVVSRLSLLGDVALKQDRLDLTAGTLVLGFDPTLAQSAPKTAGAGATDLDVDLNSLRSIVASGNVRASGVGRTGGDSRIQAGLLELGVISTPDGPAIETLRCEQDVRLLDRDRLLAAQKLTARLKPIPLDAAQQEKLPQSEDPLEMILSMTAEGDVVLDQGAKGASRADRMTINDDNGKRTVTLFGAPAIATGEKGSLASTRIELDPRSGELRVPQAGTFTGSELLPSGVRRDVEMSWTGYLMASTRDGLATASQGVKVKSRESTGATLDATAGRAVLRFTAAPPSTQPADSTDPLSSVQVESIETVELIEDVRISVDGGDRRTAYLEGPHVLYEDLSRDVIVDQPGRLFVRDLRPKAVAAPRTTGQRPSPAVSRGTLAIAWEKSLRWNARDGLLVGDGGVRLGFERADDPEGLGPVRLASAKMIGRLRTLDQPAPADPNAPDANMLDSVEMESMRFEGGVTVRSRKINFNAGHLDYDAATGLARVGSDDARRVEVFADDGVSKVGFKSLRWNVISGLVDEIVGMDGRMRR